MNPSLTLVTESWILTSQYGGPMNAGRAWRVACLVVVTAGAGPRSIQAQVDLTGHRQLDSGDSLDITQSGTSATVCSAVFAPTTCFNGAVSSGGHLEFGDDPPGTGVQVTASPVGTHLDGWRFVYFGIGTVPDIGRFFIS